jgi:hypothetical protein
MSWSYMSSGKCAFTETKNSSFFSSTICFILIGSSILSLNRPGIFITPPVYKILSSLIEALDDGYKLLKSKPSTCVIILCVS